MAQPSSSHRDRDREGHSQHRSERSTHRHHRTISSTTLLLVLSLILAVLAVMLSLPSQSSSASAPGDPATQGVWSVLTPKRSQALIARESNVAHREAEVARREAEILAGAPGGVIGSGPMPIASSCPPCVAQATFEPPPVQTVIKEVVQDKELTPPGWWKESNVRFDDILDRELKIAEREREISRREETVNRREHDASRREAWIMEQLAALGGETAVEEEYIYEPVGAKRRPSKEIPPPVVFTEIETATRTVTQVQIETQFVPNEPAKRPPPANTRRVANPTPSPYTTSFSTMLPKTTSVEVLIEHEEAVVREEPVEVEEEIFEEPRRRTGRKSPPPPAYPPAAYRPAPQRWW